MKTNVYYFDGVLHISIIKLENDILEPLKSVKNNYSRLTPNHKIIDLIKKDNEDDIQILIIINRKQKSALKLVEKYLLRDDVDLKFIKKNNIILHKDIDYAKMDINSIYDYHISNLESIKEINDKIAGLIYTHFEDLVMGPDYSYENHQHNFTEIPLNKLKGKVIIMVGARVLVAL